MQKGGSYSELMKRDGRKGGADPLHKAGVYHHAACVLISDTITVMDISLSDHSGADDIIEREYFKAADTGRIS